MIDSYFSTKIGINFFQVFFEKVFYVRRRRTEVHTKLLLGILHFQNYNKKQLKWLKLTIVANGKMKHILETARPRTDRTNRVHILQSFST